MTGNRDQSTPARGIRAFAQGVLFPRNRAPRKSARAVLVYTAKGAVSVAGALTVFVAGFFKPRAREHINAFLGELGMRPGRLSPELPEIQVDDLPGSTAAVRIREAVAQDGNVTLLELLVIARLVAWQRPERVFEIGTFDGRTTLNIAANTEGEVLTLDLPASEAQSTALPIDPSDVNYISKPVSGARFLGEREATRIRQLYGDSATFDFSKWAGDVDLVFIDGAHSREYVLSDTEKARRLLRPTGGIILWHDYDAAFDGVTLALHEIARDGMPIEHVAGTSLAISFLGDAATARSVP